MTFTVLVTDYAWPSLDIERHLLGDAGATLLVADSGDETELVRLAPHADAILTNWRHIAPEVLDAAPRCLVISRYGIGLDNIPVDHATRLGIAVANAPDFCLDEVSDHTMALLLACARRIVSFSRATANGTWDLKAGLPLPRLRGQTLGLIGYGNIPQALVPKAQGFGLKIIAYTPRLAPDALAPFGTATSDLDVLLQTSDYISIHAPSTLATRGMLGERELRLMKPSAYLINTARGALIDEDALYRALNEGWIAGAALDVLTTEPPAASHPLLGLPNVIATPHAAFYSELAIEELQHKATTRILEAMRGGPMNHIVNPTVMGQANYRIGR